MFTLSIRDELPKAIGGVIRALTAGLHANKINTAVGRAAEQLTKSHLYDLANERHRGGGGLNFYEDAADSVSHRDLGGGVEISIDKAGMAQRFYGGVIKAVNASHLWIPVDDESEGKAPGEFSDLVTIISPLTNKGVALKGDKVLFALVKETKHQAADPSVLPTDAEYTEVSVEAINDLVDNLLK
jgi:hypothetical protein